VDGWMDGWIDDKTKLIIAFCSSSNGPKKSGGSKAKEFKRWP